MAGTTDTDHDRCDNGDDGDDSINGGRGNDDSLDDEDELEDENAGRSRKYHRVIIDEGAFTKPKQMIDTWERSIMPTLLDYNGRALVMSNTSGIDPDNFLYAICHEKRFEIDAAVLICLDAQRLCAEATESLEVAGWSGNCMRDQGARRRLVAK